MGWLGTYFLALLATERLDGPDAARNVANTVGAISWFLFILAILFVLAVMIEASSHN